MRAIQLSHGHLLPELGRSEAGGQIDLHAAQVMDGFDKLRMAWERQGHDFHNRPWGMMTEADQRRLDGVRWSRTTIFAGFGNTAVYPPLLYLPAMLGWRTGQAADLTIVGSLRLARLLSAWSSVLLGWLALRLFAGLRALLFAVLLLPSSLFLQASCSQDALLLSVAALAVALISRCLVPAGPAQLELPVAVALLACAALARPPYLLLALTIFLPAVQLGELRTRWVRPALLFAAVLATVLLWHHLMAPFGLDMADEADPAKQLAFLRTHPLGCAAAILRGTGAAAVDFVRRGLYVLGWNDLLAPWPLRLLEAVALSLAAAVTWCTSLRPRAAVLLLLACAGALCAVSLAEYLIWTPPGLRTVYGVQPRYWLPVLPFVALFARREPARFPRLAPIAACMSLAVAVSLPALAARMFYSAGMLQAVRINLR